MKFVVIGDIHGKIEPIKYICLMLEEHDIDFIFLVGDIGPDFNIEDEHERTLGILYIESIFKMLKTLKKPIFFVPGNHDHDIISELISMKDIFNVDYLTNKEVYKNEKLNIFGIGGSPTTPGKWSYEWNDTEININNEYSYDTACLNLFLSHSPPYGYSIDKNWFKQHCGSKRVGKILNNNKFDLFLCGHIHESNGLETIQAIPCLNAGMVYSKTNHVSMHISSFYILETQNKLVDIKRVIIGYDSDSGYFDFKIKIINSKK